MSSKKDKLEARRILQEYEAQLFNEHPEQFKHNF